jgi:hypothetical protein
MTSPFPFVAGQILTAAQMNELGKKTTYTPTFTNLTVGNGTLSAAYFQINNLVSVYVSVVFGSTTSISGDVTVTLPIARAAAEVLRVSTVNLTDTGAAQVIGALLFPANLSTVIVRSTQVSGINVIMQNLSATVPFTWGTGDILQFSAQYEVA